MSLVNARTGFPEEDDGQVDGQLGKEEELDEEWDSYGEEEEEVERPILVHVEARLKSARPPNEAVARGWIRSHLEQQDYLVEGTEAPNWRDSGQLIRYFSKIWISESERDAESGEPYGEGRIDLDRAVFRIHIYQVYTSDVEAIHAVLADDDKPEAEQTTAASRIDLPSVALDAIWDTLVYADDLKQRLLRYIDATMNFADKSIDTDLISFNKMVLLHGPPGTGKTSLCKALAQKMAIRWGNRYENGGQLVEINSHSLFSRWFSESGKLVQKLFEMIDEMCDQEQTFVVVIIDEVESLTAARSAAMSGNEPTDGLRVVNALLTQLDKLKARKNVLIMTTSNISGSIDPAFIDRADIKEYVGRPPAEGIYRILSSCMEELMDAGLLRRGKLTSWSPAWRQVQDEERQMREEQGRLVMAEQTRRKAAEDAERRRSGTPALNGSAAASTPSSSASAAVPNGVHYGRDGTMPFTSISPFAATSSPSPRLPPPSQSADAAPAAARPAKRPRIDRSAPPSPEARWLAASARLARLATMCYAYEISGRLLRRLPVLAKARYIRAPITDGDGDRNGDEDGGGGGGRPRSVERWLDALERTVEDEKGARELVDGGPGGELGRRVGWSGAREGKEEDGAAVKVEAKEAGVS